MNHISTTEEQHRKWNIIISGLAPILPVRGIIFGFWQFSAEQEAIKIRELELIAKNDSLEFKLKIWEKQLDIYMQLANLAGEISISTKDKTLFEEMVVLFNSLYWGNMIFVEDSEVQKEMTDFHVEILSFQRGLRPNKAARSTKRPYRLIEACKHSSRDTWFEL